MHCGMSIGAGHRVFGIEKKSDVEKLIAAMRAGGAFMVRYSDKIPAEDCQRLVDVVYGAAYMLHGTQRKIGGAAQRVWLYEVRGIDGSL